VWKCLAKIRDIFACWFNLFVLKLWSIELEVVQLDDADALLLSKLDNSGGDDKDITTWLIMAYITLRYVYVNAIADYYNIL